MEKYPDKYYVANVECSNFTLCAFLRGFEDFLCDFYEEPENVIENRIDLDLLKRLYSTQLITRGEKHLLDSKRLYYKLLKRIVTEGQSKNELKSDMSVNEIVKLYAMCERALLYDWCLCNGDYSLVSYSKKVIPMFLSEIRI